MEEEKFNSYGIFLKKFKNGDQRAFRSFFGVDSLIIDYIFEYYDKKRKVIKKVEHLFWLFNYIKSYCTFDMLHCIWEVSYKTFFDKVHELIDYFYEEVIYFDEKLRFKDEWLSNFLIINRNGWVFVYLYM
jgi:hypothetical protein